MPETSKRRPAGQAGSRSPMYKSFVREPKPLIERESKNLERNGSVLATNNGR